MKAVAKVELVPKLVIGGREVDFETRRGLQPMPKDWPLMRELERVNWLKALWEFERRHAVKLTFPKEM